MEVYTAGFAKWLAKDFFNILEKYNIDKLIDIRLRPNSQLSGFTRQVNFSYFLKKLSNVNYEHRTELAPTKELLHKRRNENLTWEEFESQYINQLTSDILENYLVEISKENIIFLCSETEPNFCHRQILTNELLKIDSSLNIIHLMP
tara:strand:+ start:2804 stop:3244 length:441 start_codon:yes stop_codon:yes gene_type:complete